MAITLTRPRLIVAAAMMAAVLASPVAAQFPGIGKGAAAHEPSAGIPSPASPQTYNDSTPRGTLYHYLTSARRTDYASAASHLDLRDIPEAERAQAGPVLARHLKVILDRTQWLDLDQVSDRPEGNPDDGLPKDIERIGAIQSRDGVVDLVLRRMPQDAGEPVWKFSAALVDRIPALYDEFGGGWLGDHVPERLQRMRFLGLEAWQGLGLIVLMILSWLLGWAGSTVIARIAAPLAKKTRTLVDDRLVVGMRRSLRWALAVTVLSLSMRLLHLSVRASSWMDRLIAALAFVTAILVVGAVAEAFAQTARERLERDGQRSGAGVVNIVSRIVKALLACIALIGILQALGFNVTGLLAGFGIGGLAVALAAQKTVENMIGGIMLMADQPVKIGQFCQFGDKSGWVEDIGFRSTRVRTLERSVISIPNAEFANVQIENLSDRDRIRLLTTIGLRFETTADQLRAVLVDLRAMFLGHPKIASDPLRVRFVGFGASTLNVEIQVYVMTSDPNEFYAVREDLLLRMMDVVATNGTGFGFPSHTVYTRADQGTDPQKARASEDRIKTLRGEHKLPFPDFTPHEAAELSDRLPYPPEGSSSDRTPSTSGRTTPTATR